MDSAPLPPAPPPPPPPLPAFPRTLSVSRYRDGKRWCSTW